MKHLGNLRKMHTALDDRGNALYALPLSDQIIDLNPLLGQQFKLTYSGTINCIHCGRKTSKSFNQGYCFPCFRKLARCDTCIIKPELCHYHQGTCREPEWGENHCFQPHIVYLANSSGLKVGITRREQIPTRWIDQGAVQALPILEVTSRYLAGLLEVILKQHVSDRTHWQKMLKSQAETLDLEDQRDRLLTLCEQEIEQAATSFETNAIRWLPEAVTTAIHYPMLEYPAKIKAFNFDKAPEAAGKLLGIKGQYLIFDGGVINIRKFAGYEVDLKKL